MDRERRVSQGQDLQGLSPAGLVEDEIVGSDVVQRFGLQREMQSGTYLSAQLLGWERESIALSDLVNRLPVYRNALPHQGRVHALTPPARDTGGPGP